MEAVFSIKRIADAVSGELVNCDEILEQTISAVSTDTRTISDGAVFVALKGEKLDGHKYIDAAVKGGAVCVIANRDADIADNAPAILVKDTAQALLDLAGAYRREMHIPVVAVTGSVGKTSTRGMIASVLAQKYTTLATEGNFNNEIGVPHTLFKLKKEHEIAVIEMGMNHFGELSRITAAARPDTVVITNIGEAHIENLGSREGILKAKLEILEGMPCDGTVILCGDNDMLWGVNGTLEFETLYFGIKNTHCDITATNVNLYAEGSEFDFVADGETYHAEISVPGVHHIYNALGAILVGLKYNVAMSDIINGINDFVPVGLRQAVVKLENYTLIKDCYNANPTSMRSALEVLSLREGEGRKVAVLGDMLELGTISESAHREVGKLVCKYNTDCLVTVGEKAKLIARGAVDAGMSEDRIFSFDDNGAACAAIADIIKKGDVILLKASRSMRLEEIAGFIENDMKGSENNV